MKLSQLFLTALCTAHTGFGDIVAVDPVENGNRTTSGFDGTVGWAFRASADMTVTELGFYDFEGDGLDSSHEVGIWDLGGGLLGSAIVSTGDPMTDGFRYTAAPAISLVSGQSYVIGGFELADSDPYLTGPGGIASYTTAPQITFLENRVAPTGSFSRPDYHVLNGGVGAFGPNFQFEPAAVPEPAITALLGLALLGVTAIRRRRVG